MFNDLEPSQIAALLSCLVFDERNNEMNFTIKNERLTELFQQICEQGRRVFKVYQDAKIQIDEVIIIYEY
jgi:superfamily II RNA helicase